MDAFGDGVTLAARNRIQNRPSHSNTILCAFNPFWGPLGSGSHIPQNEFNTERICTHHGSQAQQQTDFHSKRTANGLLDRIKRAAFELRNFPIVAGQDVHNPILSTNCYLRRLAATSCLPLRLATTYYLLPASCFWLPTATKNQGQPQLGLDTDSGSSSPRLSSPLFRLHDIAKGSPN